MKNSLYVNSKGFEVTRHSYSGSSDFNFCPRLYELKRIVGWQEKEMGAALAFGNAVEAAVRHHHDIKTGAVEKFDAEWLKSKPSDLEGLAGYARAEQQKINDYRYSKTEVSWENLQKVGHEMIQLYALRLPDFPYEADGVIWQARRSLEMFPGDPELGGIEMMAYLDMIVKMKTGEHAIVDCKTSGVKIPDFICLDPQLQTYSAMENLPLAGFLWFQKVNVVLEKGSEVTFLEGPRASKEGVVCKVEKDELGIENYFVGTEKLQEDMDKLFPPAKRSKDVLDAKTQWLRENCLQVPGNILTKQKVHVRMAKVPKKQAEEQIRKIGQDIVAIHQASQENFFPMHGGIRYPAEKCPRCCMRGICAGDEKLRDDLLVRAQVDEIGEAD